MDLLPHFTSSDWLMWSSMLLIISLAWWVEGEG
jgi:hypothetical protein